MNIAYSVAIGLRVEPPDVRLWVKSGTYLAFSLDGTNDLAFPEAGDL